MCGIVGVYDLKVNYLELKADVLKMSKKVRHRGPDWEEYFYRSIFAEHFPSDTAASCVPSVPSVACSTAEALAWDASFKNMIDPSGRAVKNVHVDSYK